MRMLKSSSGVQDVLDTRSAGRSFLYSGRVMRDKGGEGEGETLSSGWTRVGGWGSGGGVERGCSCEGELSTERNMKVGMRRGRGGRSDSVRRRKSCRVLDEVNIISEYNVPRELLVVMLGGNGLEVGREGQPYSPLDVSVS